MITTRQTSEHLYVNAGTIIALRFHVFYFVFLKFVGRRNLKEKDHWGDLGVDGWIMLRWISRRWDVGIWTGLGWPRIETGGGRL